METRQIGHCIGIDVSKDRLACCVGKRDGDIPVFGKGRSFANDPEGFESLLEWCGADKDSLFVMEATGVYYENLAYWLDGRGYRLSVVLPNKVKHYTRSLNVKTKTDGVDAKVLARLGLERKLPQWHMPSPMMREIKLLTREYREAKAKLVVTKNQLHAKLHGHGCPPSILGRLERQIGLLENQLTEIETELRQAAMADPAFNERLAKVQTIPGVSFMTVICILGETNAFALVGNAKQLASYAGMDVEHRQSGSKEGKTRISKKGNAFIRNALYMPALCSTRHNPEMKRFYHRLAARKSAKKIAVTAVARKLLVLIYILWKNDQQYKPRQTEEKSLNEVDRPEGLPTQDEHKCSPSSEQMCK